jgi:hypothetical protein
MPCHSFSGYPFLVEVNKPPRGRPEKPPGEKYRARIVKAPPELWDELDRQVPAGKRAELIRRAIARELETAEEQRTDAILRAAVRRALAAGMSPEEIRADIAKRLEGDE